MKRIATHDGKFHADDVFAVATLKILLGNDIEVIRTRDQEVIDSCDYVVDVGMKYEPTSNRFDHHQVGGSGERENGVSYAAFGLVWKTYGETIAGSKEVAEAVDRNLVQFLDGIDNGMEMAVSRIENTYVPSITSIVFAFHPTWKEKPTEDQYNSRFLQFVDLAHMYLLRIIQVARDGVESDQFVRKAYEEAEDKRLIIFDNAYPFQEVLSSYPEPLFVIYPRPEGNWALKGVRVNPRGFENRLDLPLEWAGRRDEEMAKVSGVKDAIFCHNKRFLAVSKTKEGILKLAQLALNQ